MPAATAPARGGSHPNMAFKDDLIAARDSIVNTAFTVRSGTVVPITTAVGYDEAVKLHATYLYADMVDSSGLVAISPHETVGKILRLYLDITVRIIRRSGGHIRSFDGDRVMGIFVGDGRYDAAVKSALQIKWACAELIQPAIKQKYKSIQESGWVVRTGCGIASGQALIVRGGVRQSSSDLVSVGVAPNLAAKLSDLRKAPYNVRIGAGTYTELSDQSRLSEGVDMWDGPHELEMGDKIYKYYRSSFRWSIG
jgi:adenylate cyclase